jgi:hypothetical protein
MHEKGHTKACMGTSQRTNSTRANVAASTNSTYNVAHLPLEITIDNKKY